MTDELLELERLRADLPPADDSAMARARATLVHTATAAPSSRRRFPVRIAATATVGAAAVGTFLLLPSAGDNAPTASAVIDNGDGTVTVELTDLTAMPAANQVLKDKGIPAELVNLQPEGSCAPGTELGDPLPAPDGLFIPEDDRERAVTFRPDLIPAGKTLVLLGAVGKVSGTDEPVQRLGTAVEDGPPNEDGQPIHMLPFVPGQLQPAGAGTCYDNLDDIHW